MNIQTNLKNIRSQLPINCRLVVVSKNQVINEIMEVYTQGQRDFGENRVQELLTKYETLPKDINWHMIGHLQSNKVKYIASFIHLIHSVDSMKLLEEINKQAQKYNRVIDCLLQIYIAREKTKFGLSYAEAKQILAHENLKNLRNIKIKGFMGMATNTTDENLIRNEFKILYNFFKECKSAQHGQNIDLCELSMGMSNDYKIAIQEGSTLIRLGSAIFCEKQ